ncbi:penicillin-binding transpeptidase domain-containing protein [Corynebacterium sp. 153RC1]|uniref:penicillin-binding transpeptidase domain-containing protein n=1 Tax=unclassified Corynebacterium TaxID=2624378 RepID=UPI00211C3025|nr:MULTISPECIES: penicillin-binding transpeptidase domain-containing protein [unclassified Corynebacterium]MCQ9351621.1 penicillin-binding transpeptidase domain-containing protein [Corynebacterium sp. 209RC1]MCQ9353990.1 penicillin-binding transpeptidase domain-containing protein [Corynebacterium sp. 1222RC1]MCQ9355904.1 penicillin-binding transpeptidase domain-containing protein [Corynebacterium sp. 122RC1]MCQ9358148.1 penicillin-binding transpeptidase domain-containing protein [Corynebacteriu
MRASQAVILAAAFGASALVACTPKPASVEPVVESFLQQVAEQDFSGAAELTDQASSVASLLETTWGSLQAEGLRAELREVETRESIATATYDLSWDLPRERSFAYQAQMTLNRINGEWLIRWQPSALHPKLGANQHMELRSVPAAKASVVSSDGAEILSPGTVTRVLVDTEKMVDPRQLATQLAGAINAARADREGVTAIDAAQLADNLEQAQGRYSVATVDQQAAQVLQEQFAQVAEVVFNEEAAMVTPNPDFAPDITSRIATLVGEDLEGQNGWRISAVTPDGAAIDDLEYHAAQVAPAVRVSLDYNVQRAAEEAVNTRPEMEAVLVAIRPSNGDILAVAQTKKADAQGDIGLQGLYPPGSTFKIITAAAGIQDQGLDSSSIVPCPGTMNIFGRVVTNDNGFSLGNTSLQQAFARSCNTTFADISTQLELGQLKEIGSEFGIGVDYEVPGLNTITGQIPEGETPLAKTEAGYGQGEVLVSPFGMALVSATAAAGKTPLPTLVSGHETKANTTPKTPDPRTIEQLRSLMEAVTGPGGTAGGMQAAGVIRGKTGEAEINQGSHAWFTGYREDDIAFATLVVLGGGSEHAVAITDRFFLRLDELRANPNPNPNPGADPA